MGVAEYHGARGWRPPRRDQPPIRRSSRERIQRRPLLNTERRWVWLTAMGLQTAVSRRVVTEGRREIILRHPLQERSESRGAEGVRLFETLSITQLLARHNATNKTSKTREKFRQ